MIKPINVNQLIPHQHPIRMVDTIVDYDDSTKQATLEVVINDDSPFVDSNGEIAPETFLEIIAQSTAAQHGFNLQRSGKGDEKGFLVGVRDFAIEGKAFAGDKLTISVECGTEIESVSAVKGEIFNAGRKIASAGITVWHGKQT